MAQPEPIKLSVVDAYFQAALDDSDGDMFRARDLAYSRLKDAGIKVKWSEMLEAEAKARLRTGPAFTGDQKRSDDAGNVAMWRCSVVAHQVATASLMW